MVRDSAGILWKGLVLPQCLFLYLLEHKKLSTWTLFYRISVRSAFSEALCTCEWSGMARAGWSSENSGQLRENA